MWFVTKLCALWPKPVALPFAKECEDIWGPSNGSPNGLRGNLSSEHERINGTLWKSNFSKRLLRQITTITQQLSVAGVRPAIRQLAVDNETTATTTMTIITGADYAAFDSVTISKRAQAAVSARANFNMWILLGRFVFGWRSLFSLSSDS